MVQNRAKKRIKKEKRRKIRLTRFDQNLLISSIKLGSGNF